MSLVGFLTISLIAVWLHNSVRENIFIYYGHPIVWNYIFIIAYFQIEEDFYTIVLKGVLFLHFGLLVKVSSPLIT